MDKRHPALLAASLLDLGRFLALTLGIGTLLSADASAAVMAFQRLLAAPQLLLPASLFFLWLDEERYAAFRPLNFLGRIVNVPALVWLAVGLLRLADGDPQRQRTLVVLAGFCLLADLAAALILVLTRPAPPPVPVDQAAPADAIEIVYTAKAD